MNSPVTATHNPTLSRRADYLPDYPGSTFTVVFPPEAQTVNRHFPIIDDDIFEEEEEAFLVSISNPTNATIFKQITEAKVIIQDNEPFIHRVSGGSATEGNAAEFTVYRGGDLTYFNDVAYETFDVPGGATEGDDYESSSGTLTFNSNEESQTISVTTNSDSISESAESFGLRLTGSPRVGITDAIRNGVFGTITDGTQRVVSIHYVGLDQGNAGIRVGEPMHEAGFPGVFTVELNEPSTQNVTVNWEIVTSPNTIGEARDEDFHPRHPLSGTVTITAGNTEEFIRVYTGGACAYEPTETFSVRISSPDATIGQGTAGTVILDDEDPPEIRVSDAVVAEGGELVFKVSFHCNSEFSEPTSIDYTTIAISAVEGINYSRTSGKIEPVWGNDSDSNCHSDNYGHLVCEQTILVPTIEDDDLFGDKTLSVQLSNPIHATIVRGTGTGRIVNNDCVDLSNGESPPTLGVASGSAEEGESLSFTVTLSKPFCDDVAQAVTLTTTLGTAGEGDATTPTAVLGFKAGETEVVYSGVLTIEDSLDEHDETVTVQVTWHSSMPSAYTRVAPGHTAGVSATGTINDDDEPSLRVIDAFTRSEGGPLTFIVTLDAPNGKQITVDYATGTALNATAGDDYTPISSLSPGITPRSVRSVPARSHLPRATQ